MVTWSWQRRFLVSWDEHETLDLRCMRGCPAGCSVAQTPFLLRSACKLQLEREYLKQLLKLLSKFFVWGDPLAFAVVIRVLTGCALLLTFHEGDLGVTAGKKKKWSLNLVGHDQPVGYGWFWVGDSRRDGRSIHVRAGIRSRRGIDDPKAGLVDGQGVRPSSRFDTTLCKWPFSFMLWTFMPCVFSFIYLCFWRKGRATSKGPVQYLVHVSQELQGDR